MHQAQALSALIGWNQNLADWNIFARHGAIRATPGVTVTGAILPYGAFAWVAMILVHPDHRRQGLASAMMRWAMAEATVRGIAGLGLDASPAGREVYGRLGFQDQWGFARWTLPSPLPVPPGPPVRPMRPADWPAVLALDAASFGAARPFLLQDFVARLPAAAWVAEDAAGQVLGAVLGRDGLRGPQLGPVLAPDPATAQALIAAAAAALAEPAVLDLRDAAEETAAWLASAGALPGRPFTRMTLGPVPAANPGGLIAVAGPEFG